MALTRANIVSKVKDKIYNTGLGEKPSIRRGTGTVTVSGDIATFDLNAGEGDEVRAGQVLSAYSSTDTDDAYGFYVLSISTDTLTTVNGYEGAAIANSAATPALLEHQAPVTAYRIQSAIDDIINNYLYPEVYDVITDTFTPNLATGQSDADANDEWILRCWQKVGPTYYQIPCKLEENVSTTMFASGKMLVYDAIYGATAYYSAARRVSLANSENTALEELIAKGAAALVIEGTEAPTQWETAKNDSVNRGELQSASRPLWQSFYQAKRQFMDDVTRSTVLEWKIDRG